MLHPGQSYNQLYLRGLRIYVHVYKDFRLYRSYFLMNVVSTFLTV